MVTWEVNLLRSKLVEKDVCRAFGARCFLHRCSSFVVEAIPGVFYLSQCRVVPTGLRAFVIVKVNSWAAYHHAYQVVCVVVIRLPNKWVLDQGE